jgi:two-component system response regulator YesN
MRSKVLIVDDDEIFRSELRDFLESEEVIEAESGEGALNLLRRVNDIGVVILDVMMDGINGLDVLTAIKKDNPKLVVIIVTGKSSKDVAIEALKSHADDYIEKPVDVNKLKDVVAQFLDGESQDEVNSYGVKSKIQKVKRFLEKNCYKKIRLNDVAKALALSPKYLSRVFKQQMGVDFSEYRLKIQMDRAKTFLVKLDYNVNQVAEKLGYENSESFSRQFKKIVRFTPTEYRNKIQKKSPKKK